METEGKCGRIIGSVGVQYIWLSLPGPSKIIEGPASPFPLVPTPVSYCSLTCIYLVKYPGIQDKENLTYKYEPIIIR